MKKYICVIMSAALFLFALKFDWYLSGNEAVVATQQVLNGDDYAIGRVSQEMWSTIKNWVQIAGGIFAGIAIYLFIKPNKTNNENKQ